MIVDAKSLYQIRQAGIEILNRLNRKDMFTKEYSVTEVIPSGKAAATT